MSNIILKYIIIFMITVKLYELIWQNKVKGYEVSEATGISKATISKLVKGENIDVKLSTINKLCNYFKCDIKDIIEFKPD
ncbi:xRE family transcriptional regulator [Clostridium sp. CAG:967]|nr:xRE family transcriptional regulator [Clostridium sp. CAG:967]